MLNLFRSFCFCIAFYSCNNVYSADISNDPHDFANMSCSDLMFGLILESSYNKTFSKLSLAFGFERFDDTHIEVKFVQKIEKNRNGVYANLELDLANSTLNIIDPEQPIPISINKEYIPFIKTKCTHNENLYVNTAKLPD